MTEVWDALLELAAQAPPEATLVQRPCGAWALAARGFVL